MSEITMVNSAGEVFSIECSPRTAKRLETDENFREEVFQMSMDSGEKANVIIDTENKEDSVEVNIETCISPLPSTSADLTQRTGVREHELFESPGKAVWLQEQTKLLIALYKEFKPMLGKCVGIKTKKRLWTTICEKMKKEGHIFTPDQVETKWKTLERGFKRKTAHNKQTGRNRVSCSFEKELEDIMVEKSSVFPECTLSSTGPGKNKADLLNDAGIARNLDAAENSGESSNTENSSTTNGQSTRQKNTTAVAIEIKKWRQSKEKTSEVSEEYRREKLNVYKNIANEMKRKNDELKRRNDLLEKYVNNLEQKNNIK